LALYNKNDKFLSDLSIKEGKLPVAGFESKVSEIFDENPGLAREIPGVIRRIFNESELQFKRRLSDAPEYERQSHLMRLFDILFIDFYFKKLNSRFMNWVIDNYPERFNQVELKEMRAQSESHLDFYEIQQVYPGEGSLIKGLITNEEGYLKDVTSSFDLTKWDIVLCRCYPFNGMYYCTGSIARFMPTDKKFIIDRIKSAWQADDDRSGYRDYHDFAKNNWELFFRIEREIREEAQNQKLYTRYGEYQPCSVRFKVKDFNRIMSTIKASAEFNFIETKKRRDNATKKTVIRYQFDWLTFGIEKDLESIRTPDNPGNGIILNTFQLDKNGNQMEIDAIGSLYLDQFLCRLEVGSLELADFAVRHFSDLFGDAVVLKKVIKKEIVDLDNEPEAVNEVMPAPPEVEPGLMQKFLTEYYLKLLDERIPALNNMTPREARKDPAALPMLIDWLKEIENKSESDRKRGKETNVIDMMKKELDIEF